MPSTTCRLTISPGTKFTFAPTLTLYSQLGINPSHCLYVRATRCGARRDDKDRRRVSMRAHTLVFSLHAIHESVRCCAERPPLVPRTGKTRARDTRLNLRTTYAYFSLSILRFFSRHRRTLRYLLRFISRTANTTRNENHTETYLPSIAHLHCIYFILME